MTLATFLTSTVLLEKGQIKQNTERLFHQSGLFKIYHNTTSGMDEFFSLRLKIKVYGKNKSKKKWRHNWRLTRIGDHPEMVRTITKFPQT